jgi:hypothetical protein
MQSAAKLVIDASQQRDIETLKRTLYGDGIDRMQEEEDEETWSARDLVAYNHFYALRKALANGDLEVTRTLWCAVDVTDRDLITVANGGFNDAVEQSDIDMLRFLTVETGAVDPFYREMYVVRTEWCEHKRDVLNMIFRETNALDGVCRRKYETVDAKGAAACLDAFVDAVINYCSRLSSEDLRDVLRTAFSETKRRHPLVLRDSPFEFLDVEGGGVTCVARAMDRAMETRLDRVTGKVVDRDHLVLDVVLDEGWSRRGAERVCDILAARCLDRPDTYKYLKTRMTGTEEVSTAVLRSTSR